VAEGFPAERVVVKPNFLPADPGVGAHDGGYALYVGRLAPEKGVATLLEGWRRVGTRLPLKVVGSGPLEPLLAAPPPGVEWLGQQSRERVLALMRDATVLVFPSEWFETFGLGIVEAFATGLPVVASRLGVIPELVRDGETGLLVAENDPAALAAALERLLEDPPLRERLARAGRELLERSFQADRSAARVRELWAAPQPALEPA
jgi:glycosyltransferase involved in cell wall biosynthesis